MSLFEQTLINNYVFSENNGQILGGAPITELSALQSTNGGIIQGGSGKGATNILKNKSHLSVPIGLVMISHKENVFANQRFKPHQTIDDILFNNLFKNTEDTTESLKSKKTSKSKSLKLREKKSDKKQTKKIKEI
jgi:hypothetical protein